MAEEEEEEEIMIMEELEEMPTTTTTIVVLPQDIIMNILSRFPVETLLNSFKLVCKPWRTLIKDPDFVKMHLNRRIRASINGDGDGDGGGRFNSNDDNSNNSLFCKAGNTLYQLHPPFNYDYEGVPNYPAAKELDFDLKSLNSKLVGSCNGLLCVRDFRADDEIRKNYIIILNPSTRKYKVLPKEPIIESHSPFRYSKDATYGFGCCYNNNNNNDYEYKLVRILYFYPISGSMDIDPMDIDRADFKFQIDIYSMSSNSWKRRKGINDFPALITSYRPAIFLNGALHWTGSSTHHAYGGQQDLLISFDLRDEDYRNVAMPLPCVITDKPLPRDKILMNLRGCLGMICVSYNRSTGCDLDIWVMKEYGVRESWTRECVIRSSNTDPPGVLSRFSITSSTVACFLKGDQILIDKGCGRMALYDMNSKKINGDFKMVGIPIRGVHYKVPIVVNLADHVETLVSPKSSQLPG